MFENINELMPDCIAIHHDSLVTRIIKEGNPRILRKYRTIIAKDKDQFIFPVKIYVDYFFDLH
jgi:hypothetical protein